MRPTGRIEHLIEELGDLHREAQEIFNSYIDELRLKHPDQSFGTLKHLHICKPAGLSLNYIAALKKLRADFTKEQQEGATT